MKKLLSSLFLIVMVISFVPQDAFCGDHHETTPAAHSHCSLICHSCSSVVIPDRTVSFDVSNIIAFEKSYEVPYQSPILTRLKRPPIQIS